ncbi:hypothetical protein EVAR_60485_1 [Eumeta japonica]|uniref:Uncharacterized protein n=1 Tax=Eumeta variegata TaxID=151549 RepID=A0A4C1ZSQ4_EUMVA|nr:hypothetical protein EVAR_60485_1 [Eumeta japonica]
MKPRVNASRKDSIDADYAQFPHAHRGARLGGTAPDEGIKLEDHRGHHRGGIHQDAGHGRARAAMKRNSHFSLLGAEVGSFTEPTFTLAENEIPRADGATYVRGLTSDGRS